MGSLPALLFYTYPLAFNPQKAKLALEEKGLKFKERAVDLFNGDSLHPSYLRTNPSGTVPTLQITSKDGQRRLITESAQIVEYVDSLGEPLGGPDVDRALVQQWIQELDTWDGNLYAAANGNPGVAKLLGELTQYKISVARHWAQQEPDLKEVYDKKIAAMEKQGEEGADPQVVEANRRQLVAILDKAERQLATSDFLAGPRYSAADTMLTPILYRIGMTGKQDLYIAPRPKVGEYYERVKGRPSFKAAFGPASSGLTAARWILPAVIKAKWAKLRGKF